MEVGGRSSHAFGSDCDTSLGCLGLEKTLCVWYLLVLLKTPRYQQRYAYFGLRMWVCSSTSDFVELIFSVSSALDCIGLHLLASLPVKPQGKGFQQWCDHNSSQFNWASYLCEVTEVWGPASCHHFRHWSAEECPKEVSVDLGIALSFSVMSHLASVIISIEHSNPFACHKTFTADFKTLLCSVELARMQTWQVFWFLLIFQGTEVVLFKCPCLSWAVLLHSDGWCFHLL